MENIMNSVPYLSLDECTQLENAIKTRKNILVERERLISLVTGKF